MWRSSYSYRTERTNKLSIPSVIVEKQGLEKIVKLSFGKVESLVGIRNFISHKEIQSHMVVIIFKFFFLTYVFLVVLWRSEFIFIFSLPYYSSCSDWRRNVGEWRYLKCRLPYPFNRPKFNTKCIRNSHEPTSITPKTSSNDSVAAIKRN